MLINRWETVEKATQCYQLGRRMFPKGMMGAKRPFRREATGDLAMVDEAI